ncbi:MAG TPA: hypothetical protein VHC46_08905 [Thermodesulfobacteriota bacterium]|nr:hypothetical protein [Thermodesulfobacteriota bacterium]
MRESDSGSGCVCCSGGMGEHAKKEPSYREIRESAAECGRLYRELRERYGEEEVEIIQIEPKDYVYVLPRVIRDIIKRREPLVSSLRTLLLWHAVPAVIVNGKIVSTGAVPGSNAVFKEIEGLK